MKYSISILTSAILVGILLTGCNVPQKPKKPILPISKTIKKVTEINKFSHKKKDKNGKVFTKESILKEIALQGNKILLSKYGKKDIRTKNLIFKIYYDTNFDIKTKYKDMNIITDFQTQSCEKFFATDRSVKYTCKKNTTMKYYSKVKFISKKNDWDIIISSVSKYNTHAPANTSYYSKPEKLLEAVNNSLSKLKNIALLREETMVFKGGIYSEYSIPAIKSSFDRKLTVNKDKKSMIDGYSNTYFMKLNKKTYYLNINIFPYKKGHKVSYELLASYDTNKISRVSFKKKLSKLIKNRVKAIIND